MIKRILYLLYINFPFILILLAMAFLNTGCASGSNINEDSPSKFKIVTNDLLKIKQEPINFPILGKAIKEATSILNLEITSYPIKKYNHIAILKEDKTNHIFELIGLRGNQKNEPLMVYKVKLDEKNKKIISEELIFETKNNKRATDVLITNDNKILVSHVITDHRNYMSLEVLNIVKKNEGEGYLGEVIYKTDFNEPPVDLVESGGKMVQYDNNNILLTVGCFQKGHKVVSDEFDAGKILLINYKNINTKKRIFTKGHRNVQGLTYSISDNRFFGTDHGPQGGDEINILQQSNHYGWPHVTYGAPYSKDPSYEIYADVGGAYFGNHDNEKFTKPIYAFIPSIGIKAIEQLPINQYEFPQWKNDFLICSQKGMYRIRIRYMNNVAQLQFAERVWGECRDLTISSDGVVITNKFEVITRHKNPYKG